MSEQPLGDFLADLVARIKALEDKVEALENRPRYTDLSDMRFGMPPVVMPYHPPVVMPTIPTPMPDYMAPWQPLMPLPDRFGAGDFPVAPMPTAAVTAPGLSDVHTISFVNGPRQIMALLSEPEDASE